MRKPTYKKMEEKDIPYLNFMLKDISTKSQRRSYRLVLIKNPNSQLFFNWKRTVEIYHYGGDIEGDTKDRDRHEERSLVPESLHVGNKNDCTVGHRRFPGPLSTWQTGPGVLVVKGGGRV